MQIGEFYVIKGYGGYYTPSLYKDHYQKIDIDEYKKQDRKWSKESCERLLDKHNKAQDWFDAYTDYEFTHTDDTWEVIVKELNG